MTARTPERPERGTGWLDPADHPWCARLAARADEIRCELDQVIDRQVWTLWGTRRHTPTFTRMTPAQLREQARTSRTRLADDAAPSWRLFGLWLQGEGIAANQRLCPRTAAALATVPDLVNAGFSCLESGYRIEPHVGHDPTLRRAHLGLVIPEGDCGLAVDGETRRWRAGRVLLFDDTHLHEAWNHTPEHRFVLIVDVANRC